MFSIVVSRLVYSILMWCVFGCGCVQCDGYVATLVQTRRTAADVARVPGGAGCEARAALVAYRVLAPRLLLRVLPCAPAAAPDTPAADCT